MRVEVTKVTQWSDVLDAARFTQRKEASCKEPSDKFKKQIVIAEHSPLRCLMFNIDFYDIPYYVAMHLRTHKLVHQPFVSTSRPDIDGNMKPRSEQKKDDPVNMKLFLDAQEIIAISKVRLCNRAEPITKKVWKFAIEELAKKEPTLAAACVPQCLYRGFCPEPKSCGFSECEVFTAKRQEYINRLTSQVSR